MHDRDVAFSCPNYVSPAASMCSSTYAQVTQDANLLAHEIRQAKTELEQVGTHTHILMSAGSAGFRMNVLA